MTDAVFITGATGCIGAWVVKLCLERGQEPVVFDKSTDTRRIEALLAPGELERVRIVQGDVTRGDEVLAALRGCGARRIVHLAGLQVPFCKADPPLGAAVNVIGTLNLFEACAEVGAKGVVYASSAAVYGPGDGDSPDEASSCHPATHYGVFKRANEGNASVYWQDSGIPSVGLRPLTVFGVGRDQGLTSGPTKAMKAAVVGRDYRVAFGGSTDFLYVRDAAATFLDCAEVLEEGAHVFNLHGDSVAVSSVLSKIREALPESPSKLEHTDLEIPIPPSLDGRAIEGFLDRVPRTTLEDGIRETVKHFGRLQAEGRLDLSDLES